MKTHRDIGRVVTGFVFIIFIVREGVFVFSLLPPALRVLVIALVIAVGWQAYREFLVRQSNERYARWSRSQCIHCGYDLRKTRHRCPECGLLTPLSLGEVQRIIEDRQRQTMDVIKNPRRWPAEIRLALSFLVPLIVTLWACWRFSF